MNSTTVVNAFRFIGLTLLQVLVLKQMTPIWPDFNYISIIAYPIFLFMLPLRTPHTVLVLLGFALGFTQDIFYTSLGVHASAGVFTGFMRPYVLGLLEPRGGYKSDQQPTIRHLGFVWVATYSSILLFLHLFFYFSVEAFTFYYLGEIFLRTFFSFIVSIIFVLIIQIVSGIFMD